MDKIAALNDTVQRQAKAHAEVCGWLSQAQQDIVDLGRQLAAAQSALAEAQIDARLIQEDRDAAVRLLAEWCVAVDHDSSWDGWDHHYKAARHGGGPLRALLDAAIEAERKTWDE